MEWIKVINDAIEFMEKNLTEEIMTNTALAYGYESLRQAEAVL